MKRLALGVSVLFLLACSGAVTDLGGATDAPTDGATDGDKDKTVVVVPVPDGGDGKYWCCEHGADGAKKFALVDGPAACNDKFGDDGGRWVEGPECTPCCCKSGEGASETFELTTPTSCAAVGSCLAGDAPECSGGPDDEDDEGEEDKPDRTKSPGQGTRKPAKPGGGGAKRPPAR